MSQPNQERVKTPEIPEYFRLNAQVGLPIDGKIQLQKDKEAVRSYFINHVNRNTTFFTTLEEKINYLVNEGYLKPEIINKYSHDEIKQVYKRAHGYKHRFTTFMGALKFYTQYALQDWTQETYLGRYEDTMVWCALAFADGDLDMALKQVDELMLGRVVPATPTMLNVYHARGGESTSCFPAGTKVSVLGGHKNIEDIKEGDQVLTHDGTYKPVNELITNEHKDSLLEVVLSNGSTFQVTKEHPVLAWDVDEDDRITELLGKDGAGMFNDLGVAWVEAQDLLTGQGVASVDLEGTKKFLYVDDITELSNDTTTVYNLEVEDNHTYVVEGAVVHNCFIKVFQDNMNSIRRVKADGEALSSLGGGVSFNLINLREAGAPIKGMEGRATSGVLVGKVLEDIASYATQGGTRNGAFALYTHVMHPDIFKVLSVKKENADEKIRMKTISIGVVFPNIYYDLLERGETMYQFSVYDVERELGIPFSKVNFTKEYYNLVNNPKIGKYKVNTTELETEMEKLAQESGYPFRLNIDIANEASALAGTIDCSNIC